MTEPAPSEPTELVDVFYAPFVRPLGNLVILVAQAEATWLKLMVALTGCTEREAHCFLQKNAAAAKQEIMPLAKTAAIESSELEELCRSIETFYGDRERRNRLYHDEWYVSLLETPGVPATRGVQRKDGAVVWGIQHLMTFGNSLGASATTRVCSRTSCTSCKSRRAPSRLLMTFRIDADPQTRPPTAPWSAAL